MTVVGGVPPASGLAGHRDIVGRPNRKKIAKRPGLLSTHEAVAKAHAQRFAASLESDLTAVAAADPLSHLSNSLRINQPARSYAVLECSSGSTSSEQGAWTTARWSRLRRIRAARGRRAIRVRAIAVLARRCALPTRLVRLAFRLVAGLRKRQTREEREHHCRKNFGVHGRSPRETAMFLRFKQLNIGHGVFDPNSSRVCFGLATRAGASCGRFRRPRALIWTARRHAPIRNPSGGR